MRKGSSAAPTGASDVCEERCRSGVFEEEEQEQASEKQMLDT